MVEPLRKKTDIQKMQTFLQGQRYRDYLLFNFGLNTGLRIADIVKVKWEDVFNENDTFKSYFTIIEKKTKKLKRLKLNDKLRGYIKEYREIQSPSSDFIFDSRKGGHITTVQAYRLLKGAAQALNIENFGTHSMRKTYGYFVYQNTKNLSLLMDLFNHSAPSTTMRYIGINQEQKDAISSLIQF